MADRVWDLTDIVNLIPELESKKRGTFIKIKADIFREIPQI